MGNTSDADKLMAVALGDQQAKVQAVPEGRKRSVRKKAVEPPKCGLVNWTDVEGHRPQKHPNVNKWKKTDLRHHLGDLYLDAFGCFLTSPPAWIFRWLNVAATRIAERLRLTTYTADIPTMKAYLDFFFARYAQMMAVKYKRFDVQYLDNNKAISEFCDLMKMVTAPVERPANTNEVDSVEFVKAAGLSTRALVSRYGLLLAANWVVRGKITDVEKGEQLRRLCTDVADAVKQDRKVWATIRKVTDGFNPYPDWLPFKNVAKVVEKIEGILGITIKPIRVETVTNNDRFVFLR